jgi:phage terminase small subunit
VPKHSAELTPKELKFIEEYLVDLNGSAAARRAGLRNRSDQAAYTVLQRPHVKKEIRARLAARAKKLAVTSENVLKELSQIAFFDPALIFDELGRLKDIRDIPEFARKVIASIETRVEAGSRGIKPEIVTKIKFTDKTRSLELLMKHLGLLVDRSKIELTGAGGKPLVPDEEATAERVFERLKRKMDEKT